MSATIPNVLHNQLVSELAGQVTDGLFLCADRVPGPTSRGAEDEWVVIVSDKPMQVSSEAEYRDEYWTDRSFIPVHRSPVEYTLTARVSGYGMGRAPTFLLALQRALEGLAHHRRDYG